MQVPGFSTDPIDRNLIHLRVREANVGAFS